MTEASQATLLTSSDNARSRFARGAAGRVRYSRDLFVIFADCVRLLDIACVAVAALATAAIYKIPLSGDLRASAFAWIVVSTSLLAPLLTWRGQSLSPRELAMEGWRRCRDAIVGAVLLFAGLIVILYATNTVTVLEPQAMATWFAATALLLGGQRLAVAWQLRRLDRQGVLKEAVAIVGAGPLTDRLIVHLVRAGHARVVGVFDDRGVRGEDTVHYPRGTIDDLLRLGQNHALDRVVLTLPWSAETRILELVRRLKALAVDVQLCPEPIGFDLPPRRADGIDGLPLVCVAARPIARWNSLLKRLEDLAIGSLMLFLIAPVMAAIAVAIKIETPGPILFKQRRHGFNNSEIEVFKFRSMRQESADTLGARQTSRSDDRITRVGRIIRKYSLDELPQLLNVIRGDMSLVGPRPHPIGMRTANLLCHEIVEDYAHRHRVKPGITGWAQVNGFRGATEKPEQLQNRVAYDLQYIEDWSIGFDLKILAMTLVKVMSGDENAF
jgi:Undecaprenyl-phosphate glucose phosphotransferase